MSHHFGESWVLRALIPGPDCRNRFHQWNQPETRRARYRVLWNLCDGFAYDGPDGDAIRRELGLYRHVRPIANPFSRIVEFQVNHLWAGRLDPGAGDGKLKPSALPIDPGAKASKALPAALASVWRASKWHQRKSLVSRYGAKYGDMGIEILDASKSQKIKMRPIDPNEVEDVVLDMDDNVVSCVFERVVPDPDDRDGNGQRTAIYREEIGPEDPNGDESPIVYRTFKDGKPYQWPGTKGSTWPCPFPFVPVVFGKHIDLGFPFGIAEHTMAIRKGAERDDQTSNLADSNRRMVNGPWFLKGAGLGPGQLVNAAGAPIGTPGIVPPAPSTPGQPSYSYRKIQTTGRDDMPFLECPSKDAEIEPLIYPVPVAAVAAFVDGLRQGQDSDYPELQIDGLAGLSASGEARRESKKNAAQKIVERRAAHDDLLVRAQKMALAAGRILGYPDFTPLGPVEDPDDELIEHSIADRQVFSLDESERLDLQIKRSSAIKGYVDAGFSLEAALYQMDMTEQDIDDVLGMNEDAAAKAAKAQQDAMRALTGDDGEPGADDANTAGPPVAQQPPPADQPPGEAPEST